MSKHLFANEKVMKQYLGALLQDDEPNDTALAPVAKLLERVPDITDAQLTQPAQKVVPDVVDTPTTTIEVSPEVAEIPEVESKDLELTKNNTIIKEEAIVEPNLTSVQEEYVESEFQALFFEVAGLTLAVPLKSLGGIHQLGEVTALFGKPKWFKGVMLNREEKLNVVDTARWVMPEKYTPELEEKLDYQYLITLGDSPWGLLAENLINNITLKPEDIKWRVNGGKRPWLAGVIKEKMCALIDVENLNRLLEQGLDSQEQ
ncbi:chemotaxis protein CheW [Pseudoalteromonas phenolica]|uniref:Chemotaxis protein CheW n=1 Tax=Pseudoalteromonas phenolica TaxID=161398 RepID=A0A5S3YX61_9GAMM|nr:chemotaxis protein CheW [Pseudoalteromonas phenolica]TMN93791.1 chemotaxis protein CheW [Pseudoalteromonas phenolica]TMP82914.1 chemotaxis protein CheW [Pseudoalteromonas phenolica]